MTPFDLHPPTPADPAVQELRSELNALRALLAATVFLLLLFSGVLNVYLVKQASLMNEQYTQARLQVDGYEQHFRPGMTEMWQRLTGYARAHPDFAAILDKYRTNMVVIFGPEMGNPPAAVKKN